MNIVLTGLVDGGKSTLAGHLLYKLNVFTDQDFRLAEQKSIENKMPTWKYAYLLDVMEEEQVHGKTKDFSQYTFNYRNNIYTLVDTPGHQILVRNMINGCTLIDVGLFIVSCKTGEYKNALNDTEHLAILKCLGAQHLIVLLNKWDIKDANLSYDRIQSDVKNVLKKIGFINNVHFCCVSGLMGCNLITKEEGYPSESLMDIVHGLPVVKKRETPFSTNHLVLEGLVLGSKLITAGYSLVVHGGGNTKEFQVEIQTVTPKPFARKNEKCTLTMTLPHKDTFTSSRFILRDGNETVFLGIHRSVNP